MHTNACGPDATLFEPDPMSGMLDLLIRSQRELAEFAALLRDK